MPKFSKYEFLTMLVSVILFLLLLGGAVWSIWDAYEVNQITLLDESQ